ncbi:MAG: hypothetical protein ACLFTA_00065 [Candidatus Nanohaloarchaea archaeon]
MTGYDVDNVLDRPVPYEILRQIHLRDGGTYHVQLNLKAGIDQQLAREIIQVLEEAGILYRVENTDPQLFDVNYSVFPDIWEDLWIEELADVPTTPVHFGTFIENYVKSYLDTEEASNIREMLVDEFFLALNRENENLIPKDFEELLQEISEQYEGKKAAHQHIRDALNQTG